MLILYKDFISAHFMLFSQSIKVFMYPGIVMIITGIILPSAWFQRLNPFFKISVGVLSGALVVAGTYYISSPAQLSIFDQLAFTIFLIVWTWYWFVKRTFAKQ